MECNIQVFGQRGSIEYISDMNFTIDPLTKVLLLCKSHLTGTPCQGASETRNISCPSAHGAPMDLQDRHSRGQVPAECLEQKMLYAL